MAKKQPLYPHTTGKGIAPFTMPESQRMRTLKTVKDALDGIDYQVVLANDAGKSIPELRSQLMQLRQTYYEVKKKTDDLIKKGD